MIRGSATPSVGLSLAQQSYDHRPIITTGLLGKITFQVADVNDVIFNTIGVVVGYGVFVGIADRIFRLKKSIKP